MAPAIIIGSMNIYAACLKFRDKRDERGNTADTENMEVTHMSLGGSLTSRSQMKSR